MCEYRQLSGAPYWRDSKWALIAVEMIGAVQNTAEHSREDATGINILWSRPLLLTLPFEDRSASNEASQ